MNDARFQCSASDDKDRSVSLSVQPLVNNVLVTFTIVNTHFTSGTHLPLVPTTHSSLVDSTTAVKFGTIM